jgi:multiple sugar transport system permease protein
MQRIGRETLYSGGGIKLSVMKKRNLFYRQGVDGWLFIAPVVLGTVFFSLVPVVFSLVVSFSEWDGLNPPRFNGWHNYLLLLGKDRYFSQSVVNTLRFSFGSIPVAMAFGLVLALLVNQKIKGVGIYKTAYFAPVVTSSVAIAMVWCWIFAPDYGLLNTGLTNLFGIRGPDWLNQSNTALFAVILVQIWHTAGYNMVIYLAGLQGIPEHFYEAARIDGASVWHQFRYITLPLLSPTTFFLTITSIISSFQVFNLIYVMTNGGPGYATSVYIYYLYQNAFSYFKMGYASSMAWLLFILISAITIFQWKLSDRWVFYN